MRLTVLAVALAAIIFAAEAMPNGVAVRIDDLFSFPIRQPPVLYPWAHSRISRFNSGIV
jgi:hypothetical protein